ncbi:acetylcholine receptor subunit delta-like [Pecten maximus]|uniref:acetylcholine receptor subunit delta-like n=1 Tax=Pecten maximus TaxID=6579 RepID=UPI001458DDD9|nr:acetylcholine receptor subunit delta-like [Pecten maximus]
MNLLVFLIPAESGEKISYAITVLLTFAVYLSVYSDKIPPLSLPIAVFSVSLLIKLCTSCLIALCCIVISKVIYHDEDRRIPFRMQQLTSCFLRNRKIGNMKKPSQKDSTTDVGTQSDEHEAGSLKRDDFLGRKVTWKEVADAMDKLCLVFFTVMSTVETVVSLTIIMNRH